MWFSSIWLPKICINNRHWRYSGGSGFRSPSAPSLPGCRYKHRQFLLLWHQLQTVSDSYFLYSRQMTVFHRILLSDEFFLSEQVPFFFNMFIFLTDITLQPSLRHADGPADSGGRNFFRKKLICKCIFLYVIFRSSGFSTNCFRQSLHINFGLQWIVFPFFMIFPELQRGQIISLIIYLLIIVVLYNKYLYYKIITCSISLSFY